MKLKPPRKERSNMDEQESCEDMNKAPAYQWYPDKAMLDTRRLSWKARGIYRELLDTIWMQFQETCTIPNDDAFIAAEIGATLDEWREAKAEIQNEHRPILIEKPEGLFSNGLWKEREKQATRRARLRENGRKGGRPKGSGNQKVNSGKPTDNLNKRLSSPSPSPSPALQEEERLFNQFWQEYPRKIAKKQSFTSFKRQKCKDIMPTVLAALAQQKATEQWTKDKGQFIPHPTTWLNQRRWEDVLDPPKREPKTIALPGGKLVSA